MWLVKYCCCCFCTNDNQPPKLTKKVLRDQGFSELCVSQDVKGDGEIQKQEVIVREELHTPLPQQGEKVTELKKTVLRDKKSHTHSGSLVRNSGARLSWRMVPSESKRKASSHTPTEKSNEECPVECAENSLSAHEVGEEDKEVVLREVDGEQLLESNKEEVGGVFSSIVTISSTTHHHDEAY